MTLNTETFKFDVPLILSLAAKSPISKRILGNINFPKTQEIYSSFELMTFSTKDEQEGIIYFLERTHIYCAPYRLKKNIRNVLSGRMTPVICDFCYTWLSGGQAAVITFYNRSNTTNSFYVCGELDCSANVRSLTSKSVESKVQLRENISEEQKISRLKIKLRNILKIIDPVSCEY